jgi:Bacterial PH domain
MRSTILLGTARLFCCAAIVWMLVQRADARHAANVRDDGRIEFARNVYSYVTWVLIAVSLASWAIKDFLSGEGRPLTLVNAAGFGLLAVMFFVEFPATIVITTEGLEQFYWLRKNKRIRWEDIAEINTGEKSHTVTVTSADGTKIVHSAQLADRARLLLELKQHCGDSLPPDFPREPIATVSTVNQS